MLFTNVEILWKSLQVSKGLKSNYSFKVFKNLIDPALFRFLSENNS
jgi:hypothetical protein